jgi:hypothetical protein
VALRNGAEIRTPAVRSAGTLCPIHFRCAQVRRRPMVYIAAAAQSNGVSTSYAGQYTRGSSCMDKESNNPCFIHGNYATCKTDCDTTAGCILFTFKNGNGPPLQTRLARLRRKFSGCPQCEYSVNPSVSTRSAPVRVLRVPHVRTKSSAVRLRITPLGCGGNVCKAPVWPLRGVPHRALRVPRAGARRIGPTDASGSCVQRSP